MSTHFSHCVYCGKETACSEDAHALGSGASPCHDENNGLLPVEFCSLDCFLSLLSAMQERLMVWNQLGSRSGDRPRVEVTSLPAHVEATYGNYPLDVRNRGMLI